MNELLGISLEDLKSKCANMGLKPYLSKQIFDWVYQKNALYFEDMKNISSANQEKLKNAFRISPFVQSQQHKAEDGSAVKFVLECLDGHQVESVVLKEKEYNTLCVSSQIGCPLHCAFCVTGQMGFVRNLTVAEIVGQILYANAFGYQISRVVFMGMGEPMLNIKNVIETIRFIIDPTTYNISRRKVTVSTAGIKDGILELMNSGVGVKLAFSVGHSDKEKRKQIMGIENKDSITTIKSVLRQYSDQTKRKLTLEYTLIKNVNDDRQAIDLLIILAKELKAKINLIQLNEHPIIPFVAVSNDRAKDIKYSIQKHDIAVTIRFKKGRDVFAACGQLAAGIMAASDAENMVL
jgi:23S rRNA (adenine2503-C2)-methyltransferase